MDFTQLHDPCADATLTSQGRTLAPKRGAEKGAYLNSAK
jgi:hypothetical protein